MDYCLSRNNFSRRALLAGAAMPLVRGEAKTIAEISKHPEFYHGWPTLARRANGDLLVVYSGGRESHVCPFGRVELIRSHDEGKTWNWPEVLMDSAIDDRDAGVCETAKGSLLVSTFTSLAYEAPLKNSAKWDAEKRLRWEAANSRVSEAERKAMLGTWLLRSEDGGKFWSAPFRVPVNSPHGPVPLSKGRLLYVGKKLWDAGSAVGACLSVDDGRTWRWLSAIPARKGDDVSQYHELHAVEAKDGTIVVHIRNHNKPNAGETLQCESRDAGKTWTEPHAIGVWGLPSHLLRLRDGRLLMSYGYRRAPFGNQARVSADNGKTWGEAVTISDDGASGDLGYPSTVETADGGLITVWYELPRGGTKAQLRMARWRV